MSAISGQISTFVHATEAPDRVRRAVDYVCPRDLFFAKVEKRRLKGHYGNEILTVTLSIHGSYAESFFQRLWALLPSSHREAILGDLDSRLDKDGKLHLRLDKQESLRGNLLLQDRDPIKIELTFRTMRDQSIELGDRIRDLSERLRDAGS